MFLLKYYAWPHCALSSLRYTLYVLLLFTSVCTRELQSRDFLWERELRRSRGLTTENSVDHVIALVSKGIPSEIRPAEPTDWPFVFIALRLWADVFFYCDYDRFFSSFRLEFNENWHRDRYKYLWKTNFVHWKVNGNRENLRMRLVYAKMIEHLFEEALPTCNSQLTIHLKSINHNANKHVFPDNWYY